MAKPSVQAYYNSWESAVLNSIIIDTAAAAINIFKIKSSRAASNNCKNVLEGAISLSLS